MHHLAEVGDDLRERFDIAKVVAVALADLDVGDGADFATGRLVHAVEHRPQRLAKRAACRGAERPERAARGGRGVGGDLASVSLSVSVLTLGGERRRRSMTGGASASVLVGSVLGSGGGGVLLGVVKCSVNTRLEPNQTPPIFFAG